MRGPGRAAWLLPAVLAAALLALPPAVRAQLSDDARTSTLGTQFVKPPPQPAAPKPAPAPPKAQPQPAPPQAAAEPPKPAPPPRAPARYPSVVFLLDTSDSMLNRVQAGGQRTKLDEAKDALIQVLRDMAPDARVQVWTFNTSLSPVLIPGVPERSFIEIGRGNARAQLIDRVRLFRTAGGTNLYQSIVRALDLFAASGDQQAYRSGQRFPVLVVLSDGEDGNRTPETLDSVQKAKAHQPLVTVNTIGFNLAGDHAWFEVLCKVASRPDGCATADDEAQLKGLLSSFYRFRAG
jgi:von Willebrand factor type A domain